MMFCSTSHNPLDGSGYADIRLANVCIENFKECTPLYSTAALDL